MFPGTRASASARGRPSGVWFFLFSSRARGLLKGARFYREAHLETCRPRTLDCCSGPFKNRPVRGERHPRSVYILRERERQRNVPYTLNGRRTTPVCWGIYTDIYVCMCVCVCLHAPVRFLPGAGYLIQRALNAEWKCACGWRKTEVASVSGHVCVTYIHIYYKEKNIGPIFIALAFIVTIFLSRWCACICI